MLYYQEGDGVNSFDEILIPIKLNMLLGMIHTRVQTRQVDLITSKWNAIVVHSNDKTLEVERNTNDIITAVSSRRHTMGYGCIE